MDIRNRKTVLWMWVFNLAMGLIVLPLLIGWQSNLTFWTQVAKLCLILVPPILIVATLLWVVANALLRRSRVALLRGDYEKALSLTARMKSVSQHDFRAYILSLAGRPDEAEKIIGKLIPQSAKPADQERRLALLADIRMDQGRWEDARQSLDMAMRLDDALGSHSSTLAEWYLLQNLEPQKALDLLEQANGAPHLARLEPTARNGILAMRLAMKSLALARLGKHPDAESAMAEAQAIADPGYVPGMALLDWRIGMAFAAMGQPAKAREHYQKAAATDPHGKYGRLAVRGLEDNGRSIPAN